MPPLGARYGAFPSKYGQFEEKEGTRQSDQEDRTEALCCETRCQEKAGAGKESAREKELPPESGARL
ncbi:MAG: hypothetical protein M3119_04715 [Verrucomicrobiota bacterium]|nr:hypothetical protein [Verrucomicrobiota bacterium]